MLGFRRPRLFGPALAGLFACATLLSLQAPARAQDSGDVAAQRQADLNAQRAAFKQLAKEALWEGMKTRIHEAREGAELRRRAKHGDKLAIRALRARKIENEAQPAPDDLPIGTRAPETPASVFGTASIPANVRCNTPGADLAGDTQAEESIAALGGNVVVAWNDGNGFDFAPAHDVQGYAWSSDAGVTWHDGGNLPHPSAFPAWNWTSDPVMTVNEKTGLFYYCGLGYADGFAGGGFTNTIGVAIGHFTAGAFAWDSTFVVRTANSLTTFLDKQWIVADSLNNNVYITNTTFTTTGDQIDFYSSTNGGRTWSAPTMISNPVDNGLVQGSRPVVGPNGEIYTTWLGIDQVTDQDHFRFRSSTNFGVGWNPEVNAADIIENYGTGAPGFNRGRGITFPSISVDRTNGPHRGRVYVAWNEAWDWLNDGFAAITAANALSESDPAGNNATNSAAATANPFTIGKVLRGTLQTTGATVRDLDYWSVPLTAGDRMLVWVDSISTGGRAWSLRLFAPNPDNAQLLAYARADSTNATNVVSGAVWIFMAPTTGTYYLRIASNTYRTTSYRIRTTTGVRATERGRDQRDAFVDYSDNGGASWSTPTQANDNATGFDEFLPEINVAADGMPYAEWFDSRDDVYGSRTHVYLTRSEDGGATWAANQRITDAQSNFSTVPVNIQPNMGDYLHITSGDTNLYPVWADGRNTLSTGPGVDVWTSTIPTTSAVTLCQADTTLHSGDAVSFLWNVRNDNPLFAGNYQITVTQDRAWGLGGSSALAIGATSTGAYSLNFTVPDTAASGPTQFCVTASTPGGVVVGQCCVNVTVIHTTGVGPRLSGLALAPAFPNPAPGRVAISFSLPSTGRARLAVYDLAGARVRTLVDGERGAGPATVNWDGRNDAGRAVQAGAYFYRLEFGGRNLTQRLVLML